jgi:voltage-gated sodium channel
MIVLNSVSIAMATMDWVRDYPDRKMAVFIVNALFRVLFTIELLLRFLYAGPRFFADGWCLFDLFIITSSWFVYPLLGFRMFRLVRALRLATRVKELQYLAKALLTSAPQMFCILFLLTIQFYIFTIVFTDLFKDLYKQGYTSEDYFSRLDITCFTLFQILTLDVWSEIAHEVMAVYPWAWFPFVFFIMTTTFFFLNLIIAVICEAVSKVGHERQINELKRQMGLPNADTDDSSFGSVSDAVKTDAKLSRVENKVDKLAQQVELLLLHHKTPKDAPS